MNSLRAFRIATFFQRAKFSLNMSTSKLSAPYLTQRPPRSPRTRLGGYVLLPRMLDKGRATLAGMNGEYHYNCPPCPSPQRRSPDFQSAHSGDVEAAQL